MRATGHEPSGSAGTPKSERAEEREATRPSDNRLDDAITRALEDSFPASDAPPWTASVTRGAPEPEDAAPRDVVTEASEQSFPASDAPPWTTSVTRASRTS